MTNRKTSGTYRSVNPAALFILLVLTPSFGMAQAATAPTPTAPVDEEIVQLSPFEVSASQDTGYVSSTTLAGNRMATDLKDLGTSLSVYNELFLKDIGATDSQSLLKYSLGTEVGGVNGNYSGTGGGTSPNTDASYLNPQSNNRVRGLVAADNTRDLFLTNINWDGYNIEAVDIQRGPNAILFGQGSPSGVINTRTKQAVYRNLAEVSFRFDQYGSRRETLDFNRVLLKEELSIRVAAVDTATKFREKPAFEDFNRQFFALRYEPKFMKRGDARTIIKVNAEMGQGDSNRPRNTPPGDRITPWFTALGQKLYNVAWMNDGNTQIPGRGDAVQTGFNLQANPNYQPWVNTNFGNNYYGGAEFQYLPGTSTPATSLVIIPNQYLGTNALGVVDNNIGGLAPSQPHGIRSYRDYANAVGLPFASLVKNTYITDPKIFDFYNKLIDGDIKREWNKFRASDATLSQTFFHDTMGFDLGYHNERVTNGNYSPLQGDGGSIFIDFNSVWPDGTNEAAGGWYTDGTKNPGVGRAFIQLGNGSSQTITNRESTRATAFISHDFNENRSQKWFRRILGKHMITGMASKDTSKAYTQNWSNSVLSGDYYNNAMFAAVKQANGRFWADWTPIRTVYLSDSLVGKQLGQNLGINSPGSDPAITGNVSLRYFDSHWNATGVKPGDPWYNQSTVSATSGPTLSTQSENPANYIGWVTKSVPVLSASNDFNRDLLTSTRVWDNRSNKASAIVWQGKFWDDSIVATAGLRRDEVNQDLTNWNWQQSSNRASGDPTLVTPTVNLLGPIKRQSKSYGVVAHLNSMPFLSTLLKKSPIEISATYNKSDNFQTGQIFRDYWGKPLPLAGGKTKDMGILLATKDGKYSLRVNKFQSDVANNTSTFIQYWNYGNNIGIMAQAYSQMKYNYETRSDFSSTHYGNNIISDLPVPTVAAPNPRWNFDYQPLNGQTLQQAQDQEVAVINAWDQWLTEMAPLPQLFGAAWGGINWVDKVKEQAVDSFRFTQDLVSKGTEIELNAQITEGWRLTFNASKITAVVDNIGKSLTPDGKMTMIDYLLDFDRRLNTTAMGDLRIWGGGSDATARQNWNGYADGDLKARLAEQGTNVPENRVYHANLISSYDFNHGKLRGWRAGGAIRYQSAAVLAYTPIQNPGYISYDLSKPYKDKALADFDVWIGYGRKIYNNKVQWSVQLNVQNVGVGKELIPVTVQPDGTPAAYRIRPAQQFFMTNTFKF